MQQHSQLLTSVTTQFGLEFYPAPEQHRSLQPALLSNHVNPMPLLYPPSGQAVYGAVPSALKISPENSPVLPVIVLPPP